MNRLLKLPFSEEGVRKGSTDQGEEVGQHGEGSRVDLGVGLGHTSDELEVLVQVGLNTIVTETLTEFVGQDEVAGLGHLVGVGHQLGIELGVETGLKLEELLLMVSQEIHGSDLVLFIAQVNLGGIDVPLLSHLM